MATALGTTPSDGMGVAGFAAMRATPTQIAELRKNPGIPTDRPLPAGLLKNSDDQTILALAAIASAVTSMNRPTDSFRDWGVVAASTLVGRVGIYNGLSDFRREGAWAISPHTIPHLSLHSVSGTISQALGFHGPNFGVGSGLSVVSDAFLGAATLLSDNRLPGLWVVITGHEPESLPNRQEPETPNCLAAALALKPSVDSEAVAYLRVDGRKTAVEGAVFRLSEFVTALESMPSEGRWALPEFGSVELTKPVAAGFSLRTRTAGSSGMLARDFANAKRRAEIRLWNQSASLASAPRRPLVIVTRRSQTICSAVSPACAR